MTTYDEHAEALFTTSCERCLKLLYQCTCDEHDNDELETADES